MEASFNISSVFELYQITPGVKCELKNFSCGNFENHGQMPVQEFLKKINKQKSTEKQTHKQKRAKKKLK